MPINIDTTMRNALLDRTLRDPSAISTGVFDGGFLDLYDGAQPTSDGTAKSADVNVANPIAAWVASTAYAVDDTVRPTTANGFYYRCSVAGTTAGAEPTFPTTLGATVVDGGVTWVEIGAEPTLLASLSLAASASFDAASAGTSAIPASIQDAAANAAGTASWFRLRDSGNTVRIDGDVGITSSGAALELSTTTIVFQGVVTVTALSLTHPA